MGGTRRAVHALVVLAMALLAYGASGAWSSAADATGGPAADDRATTTSARTPMVYYGRLGVPFLPREGTIALSGARIRSPEGDASPDASRRPCPTRVQLAAPAAAPRLARGGGA